MLAVATVLPDVQTTNPPIILVHGAANSAAVWTHWQRELATRGWPSYAIDLRGHGRSDPVDLSKTSMDDYAQDVMSLASQLSGPPVVAGWSMGGLVAMMVAASVDMAACVALAPSAPSRRADTSVALRVGVFGPEEYGVTSDDPEDQPEMADLDLDERRLALASLGLESRYARDERTAGVVIDSLSCPLLLVTGTGDRSWPRERYDDVGLGAIHLTVEGASHWGLVLNRRALSTTVPAVLRWLAGVVG